MFSKQALDLAETLSKKLILEFKVTSEDESNIRVTTTPVTTNSNDHAGSGTQTVETPLTEIPTSFRYKNSAKIELVKNAGDILKSLENLITFEIKEETKGNTKQTAVLEKHFEIVIPVSKAQALLSSLEKHPDLKEKLSSQDKKDDKAPGKSPYGMYQPTQPKADKSRYFRRGPTGSSS